MDDLAFASARTLTAAYRAGTVRPLQVVEGALDRIARLDPTLHAFLYVDADGARREAAAWDARIAAGAADLPPLAGVPVAVKDNICTRGVPTTCASRILEGWRPPYDATVVTRLREAGAIILGKTNLDEFAMGSSTEYSAFGPTRNPWDLTRVPGGSSGGSAAAVAAGLVPLALGSDTGGSIRLPAGFCGVVGLKPTYGRVSRYGLVAFASSLDQIGPIARDVADCALLLGVLAGRDPADATSADVPVPDYRGALARGAAGLRLGVPREAFGEGVAPAVAAALREALGVFEGLGLTVEEIGLPTIDAALPAYYILAPAEASSNLARYDGVQYGLRVPGEDLYAMVAGTRRQGFGAEVQRRIMLGTYALSAGYYEAFYLKAQRARTLVARDFARAFTRVDLVVLPVAPTPAFRLGEKADDPLQMYLSDIFTISVNLAGLPGLALPCGTADGLPVGLQLVGRAFEEVDVLRAGYAYEQAAGWHGRRPPVG
ncbi:MAG: Asp-tRNA(Asn)/Glu-tRNA(Gln) amidotransferase subunit GatA [Armatimonadota bacterium]|nr:Asp-tRNA(Asn)/Glu-tRNA(Gln) amidotransferase subunit GatA [Armatimonadota bacterium]MDR7532462.1 Asp-tRNA(Asn)/Glu-tRNA(Gln) amidotransferase subunit GatA [Armatimonadota bacterium]MDR7535685.1 Asp-tRNA(Asn)/Glu-tRNA(Gln) amidotransferase subunit GatA [Armatimonadota bacterium]